jgi:Double zinc ribbon
MYCTDCGGELRGGSAFCTSCGAAVSPTTTPSPPETPPTCASCGNTLRTGAGFCTACGAPVAPETTVGPAPDLPATAPTIARAQSAADYGESSGPSAPKRHAAFAPMALLAVALVAAIGIGAWAVTANRGETASGAFNETGGENTADVALPPSASYDALVNYYDRAGRLSDEVGRRTSQKPVRGTGFAYEVFNPSIGARSRATRQRLVDDASTLLEQVVQARGECQQLQVDVTYVDEKANVDNLYSLLEQRMRAMYDAAVVALDNPAESAWRPVLSPRSSEAYSAFAAAYEAARPYQR